MTRNDMEKAVGEMDDRHILEAEAASGRGRKLVGLRRVAVLAAAAVLCIALALPVMAQGDASYELLYAAMPGLAQRFRPVQMSCEDNGVRMEVVAASVEGDTAEAYISLCDLESSRVDGTTDLFDSERFHTAFDSTGTCRLESYDEETGAATFYVLMQTVDGQDIRAGNDKVTFSVSEFLSGKQSFEGVSLSDAPIDLTNEAETQTGVELRGGFTPGGEEYRVLVPQAEPLMSPCDGVTVTAAGWVDGKLHVQVLYRDIRHTDDHGFIYIVSADGETVDCDWSVSFWDDMETDSYEEYVFDITPEEWENGALYGDFYTCDSLTEGNWRVTFPLDGQ